MNDARDHSFEPPATDKEVVIYKGDWGFRLAAQQEVLLNRDASMVSLSIPDRGGTHYVDRIEETDEEFHIHVGEWFAGHGLGELPGQYPFPSIDEELGRLTREYSHLLGAHSPDAPVGWAQGASYDSHTTWLRSEIRRMRREGA